MPRAPDPQASVRVQGKPGKSGKPRKHPRGCSQPLLGTPAGIIREGGTNFVRAGVARRNKRPHPPQARLNPCIQSARELASATPNIPTIQPSTESRPSPKGEEHRACLGERGRQMGPPPHGAVNLLSGLNCAVKPGLSAPPDVVALPALDGFPSSSGAREVGRRDGVDGLRQPATPR